MRNWLLILMVFPALFINAHQLEVSPMFWGNLKVNGEINENNHYFAEFQGRKGPERNSLDAIVLRVALGHSLTNNTSLWLGYDFLPEPETSDLKDGLEQRLWQQLTWNFKQTLKLKALSRTRLEERNQFGADEIAVRFRQQLKATIFDAIKNNINLVLSEEIFINFNHPSWITANTIDQNRVFIGVETELNQYTNIVAGYLNQIKFRTPNDNLNHIAYLSLAFKLGKVTES